MYRYLKTLFAAVPFAGLVASDSVARSVVPPAESVSELLGAWLGESDFTEYVRIEITASGEGHLAIQWLPGGEADLYEIQKILLNEYRITFQLQPLSDSEAVLLSGTATATSMDLKLRGQKKWERKLRLEREGYVLDRIRAVKDAFTKRDKQR